MDFISEVTGAEGTRQTNQHHKKLEITRIFLLTIIVSNLILSALLNLSRLTAGRKEKSPKENFPISCNLFEQMR